MSAPSGGMSAGNLLMMKQQKSVPVNSRLQINASIDDQIQNDDDAGVPQGETSFDYNWDDDAK